MAAKEVVTILGFAATPDEWTAWSAVGTIGATGVAVTALLLPLFGAWRRRVAAATDRRKKHVEVVSAVKKALALMAEVKAIRNKDEVASISQCAAIARYKSKTLKLLAARPEMTDSAIDCALGAAEMLDFIVESDTQLREGMRGSSSAATSKAYLIGMTVKDRIQQVSKYHEQKTWNFLTFFKPKNE